MLAMLSSTGLVIDKDELDDRLVTHLELTWPFSSCRVDRDIATLSALGMHCTTALGMNSVELDLVLLLQLLVIRNFFDFGGAIIDVDGRRLLRQRDSHAAMNQISVSQLHRKMDLLTYQFHLISIKYTCIA